jgi:hypothetical protein
MGDNYLENSMMEPFGFGVVPCCSRVGTLHCATSGSNNK